MQISFFEEYPQTKTLEKLKLIKFQTKLYLAEYNLESYKEYKKEIQRDYENVKEVIWWPILNVDEGYWFSPWSKRIALLRTFHFLLKEEVPILWDAEVPKRRIQILKEFPKYFKNKRLIRSFFKKYKGKICTAEYFLEHPLLKGMMDWHCLSFDPKKYEHIPIKMMYTSVSRWLTPKIIKYKIKKYIKKYDGNLHIGLGCIAVGMHRNEKILTPVQLERDLKICQELNIPEVVIYRLGGINEEYAKVLNKFI